MKTPNKPIRDMIAESKTRKAFEDEKEAIAREEADSAGCSATESRIERLGMAQIYGRLATYPESQPEAISNHYVSCAMEAMRLREMLKLKRNSTTPTPELDECIQFITATIKKEHKRAFGISLEWRNN